MAGPDTPSRALAAIVFAGWKKHRQAIPSAIVAIATVLLVFLFVWESDGNDGGTGESGRSVCVRHRKANKGTEDLQLKLFRRLDAGKSGVGGLYMSSPDVTRLKHEIKQAGFHTLRPRKRNIPKGYRRERGGLP